MNLEQIDTSTTAGKAEVMRLAAEGRRLACREEDISREWFEVNESDWDWRNYDYAIIAEPVGPDELWAVQFKTYIANFDSRDAAETVARINNGVVVRYARADLAGEVEP